MGIWNEEMYMRLTAVCRDLLGNRHKFTARAVHQKMSEEGRLPITLSAMRTHLAVLGNASRILYSMRKSLLATAPDQVRDAIAPFFHSKVAHRFTTPQLLEIYRLGRACHAMAMKQRRSTTLGMSKKKGEVVETETENKIAKEEEKSMLKV